MGVENLTKYNFCSGVYKNNGITYYKIITNELVEDGVDEYEISNSIVVLSEDLVYKVLKGRKYKIVNLKIENNRIVLKDTSQDLDLVKNLCYPIQLFTQMEQPFKDNQIKFMGKKLKYILRNLLSKYKEQISMPNKRIDVNDNYGIICYLTLISKKKERYKYEIFLEMYGEDFTASVDYVRWNNEILGTAAHGDIEDYNTNELETLLENIFVGVIYGKWRGY